MLLTGDMTYLLKCLLIQKGDKEQQTIICTEEIMAQNGKCPNNPQVTLYGAARSRIYMNRCVFVRQMFSFNSVVCFKNANLPE